MDRDQFNDRYWGILPTLMWIATRDPDLVRGAMQSHKSIEQLDNELALQRVIKGALSERWPHASCSQALEQDLVPRLDLQRITPPAYEVTRSRSLLSAEHVRPDTLFPPVACRVVDRNGTATLLVQDAIQRGTSLGMFELLDPPFQRARILKLWPPIEQRPIGSVAAETNCQNWLEEEMRRSLDGRPKQKRFFWAEARNQFRGLSERGFNRAWAEAVKVSGAVAWRKGGAPKKSRRQ